jgi:CheY-like chemotaxis protein
VGAVFSWSTTNVRYASWLPWYSKRKATRSSRRQTVAKRWLKVRAARPDAVVLDLAMPVMDGWSFAEACHALPREPIPILIVSASTQLARAAEQLRAFGVHASLPKPFDLEVLLHKVRRITRHSSGER